MKHKKKSPAVVRTTEECASHTTVHGISYIFDRSLPVVDRLLWLVVVVSFLALASYLSYNSYTEWRGDQVITTLKDTVMPVSEVAFPAITICGGGNHMDNVERAVLEDFRRWRKDDEKKGIENIRKDLADYMIEVYQMPDQDTNILDILNMMVASNVETSVAGNAVRQNVLACGNELTTTQEKIEASKKEINGPTMFISNGNQFQLLSPNMSVVLPFGAPDSRTMHVGEFLQDRVILCGGMVEGDGGYLDTCYQLSPVCSGWTEPLQQARNWASSVGIGDSMLFLAGEDAAGLQDSVQMLDLSTGSWTMTQWKTPAPGP